MVAFEDKTLQCIDCGESFPHTAEDQERYAGRGFTNDPKRCRPCREKRKEEVAGPAIEGFEDKSFECVDCAQTFVHAAKDQAYYAERGFTNEPKRCPDCRNKRKERARESRRRGGGGGGGGGGMDRGPRPSFEAVCAECGVTTTVPFKPTQGRPVYCRDCFRAQRS